MKHPRRMLPVLAGLLAMALRLPAGAADDATATHHLRYSVSDRSVTVVSAVTPYDSNPGARDAFLHWFKRGFETVLADNPPLMVEWEDSAKGKAGRSGYDFGMDEAERHLEKRKEANQSLWTVPIPPG